MLKKNVKKIDKPNEIRITDMNEMDRLLSEGYFYGLNPGQIVKMYSPSLNESDSIVKLNHRSRPRIRGRPTNRGRRTRRRREGSCSISQAARIIKNLGLRNCRNRFDWQCCRRAQLRSLGQRDSVISIGKIFNKYVFY